MMKIFFTAFLFLVSLSYLTFSIPVGGEDSGAATSVGNNDACTICMDEINEQSGQLELPCKHGFHRECIDSWIRAWSTCPNCRACVTPEFFESSGIQPMSEAQRRAARVSSDVEEYMATMRQLRGVHLNNDEQDINDRVMRDMVNPLFLTMAEEFKESAQSGELDMDQFLSNIFSTAFSGMANVLGETSQRERSRGNLDGANRVNSFNNMFASDDFQNILKSAVEPMIGSILEAFNDNDEGEDEVESEANVSRIEELNDDDDESNWTDLD
jgi:hypothetical protein